MSTGLIPAGAGNTDACFDASLSAWAHPRRRGEHVDQPEWEKLLDGSSPQARGTHSAHCETLAWRGLIPAGAGNTAVAFFTFTITSAHPRRRGEHADGGDFPGDGVGSSPQARGTRCYPTQHSCATWLIPAGAGNTNI